MKNHTRRAIAIIAASVINKQQYSSVYDYIDSKYHSISCDISSGNVNAYDYELKCYITGNVNSDRFSLYHYGNSKQVELDIKKMHFEGHDHDSKKNFSGEVKGSSISVYDYELSKNFNYSV